VTARRAAALVALVLVSCAGGRRGTFEVISAHGVPPKYVILAPSVSGRACRIIGVGPLLELAVEDALAKVPQANVLASVDISIRRGLFGFWFCYQVEGAALLVTP
jgi:hypothetical protein